MYTNSLFPDTRRYSLDIHKLIEIIKNMKRCLFKGYIRYWYGLSKQYMFLQ